MSAIRTKFPKNAAARDNDLIMDALVANEEKRDPKFRQKLPKKAKEALTRQGARMGKKK